LKAKGEGKAVLDGEQHEHPQEVESMTELRECRDLNNRSIDYVVVSFCLANFDFILKVVNNC
jgi:hypothetical protein